MATCIVIDNNIADSVAGGLRGPLLLLLLLFFLLLLLFFLLLLPLLVNGALSPQMALLAPPTVGLAGALMPKAPTAPLWALSPG